MDRLAAMEMLVQVVDRGSMSAASRAMRVPLPTISRKVSELEVAVGTRLLMRTTRKITLTDAGISYVESARRILEQVESAEHEAAGEFTAPRGELIVTAPVMFGRLYVLPVVTDFLALFPDITVRLMLGDRNVHFVDDHIDMAVRIGRLSNSALTATNVGSMRTIVCASPTLLASCGTPQEPEGLLRLPCINVDLPSPALAWRFRRAVSNLPLEIPVKPRLSVTSTEAASAAAIRGAGAARLLYYQVADAVDEGSLKIILAGFEPEPEPIHLVHAARGQMTVKMRRFIDFAGPRLREVLNVLETRHAASFAQPPSTAVASIPVRQ
jgi:DNA-binding transcriptional LysR family regulator